MVVAPHGLLKGFGKIYNKGIQLPDAPQLSNSMHGYMETF